MNEQPRNGLVWLLALAAALLIPGLLPRSAHGMYDPKHGRWLQRDPNGVQQPTLFWAGEGSVLLASHLAPHDQYDDGVSLYQYVRGDPASAVDFTGLGTYKFGTRFPRPHPSIQDAENNDETWGKGRAEASFKGNVQLANTIRFAKAMMHIFITKGRERGYPESARMLEHYAGNTGAAQEVDFMRLIRQDEGARNHFAKELGDAQKFIENNVDEWEQLLFPGRTMTVTGFQSGSASSNKDWIGAVGKYYSESQVRHVDCTDRWGRACIAFKMTWQHNLLDNYDWPLVGPKVFKKWGIEVWDPAWFGMLHHYGEARAFPIRGSHLFTVEWTRGARYPDVGSEDKKDGNGYIKIDPRP